MSGLHDYEMILSSTPDVVSSGRVAVSDTETSSLSGFFANNGTSALKRKYQEWTKDLDEKLESAVKQLGCPSNVRKLRTQSDSIVTWNSIADKVGRSGKQCRERWMNHLCVKNRRVKPWTQDEWSRLEGLVDKHGKQWSKFVPFFPGCTSLDLRNKWFSRQRSLKRGAKQDWTSQFLALEVDISKSDMEPLPLGASEGSKSTSDKPFGVEIGLAAFEDACHTDSGSDLLRHAPSESAECACFRIPCTPSYAVQPTRKAANSTDLMLNQSHETTMTTFCRPHQTSMWHQTETLFVTSTGQDHFQLKVQHSTPLAHNESMTSSLSFATIGPASPIFSMCAPCAASECECECKSRARLPMNNGWD